MCISLSNAGYMTFGDGVRVLATHSIRQFPLHFPSRASPCATMFRTSSTSASLICLNGMDWDFSNHSGGTHCLYHHCILQNMCSHLPNYMALQPPVCFTLTNMRTCNLKWNSVFQNMATCRRNLYQIAQLIDQLMIHSFLWLLSLFLVYVYILNWT